MAQPEKRVADAAACEESLAHRFEVQVRLRPDHLAIRTSSGELTYAQLNALANRKAHVLLGRHLPSGEPIALLLDQGVAYISALLGSLKAGLCYVPLDPANPPARNSQMLQDSGARCILTNSENLELARSIADARCEVLNIDLSASSAPTDNPRVAVSPDALAYVLYTSGSTGRPKGVVMDHRSVLHNVMRHTEAFGITPDDRQTLLYTCSVYGGTRDIFNALLNGASLHTFPVKQQGVAGLSQWLRDARITLYCSVATVFRQFVATLDGSERFEHLRLIKLGGEASHRKDIDLFRAHFSPACVVHCGLGATETGVVRHFFVDHGTKLEGSAIPLGYPIDGVEVLLLDENNAPVKMGEVGEIVVRSRYIARGYWQRPDLNSTVIVPDPLDPQVRLYRSGDLGVFRSDGCLEHRGRKDFLVKIRGNRVELAEIETVLRDLDGVAHAVVMARRDQRQHDYLVAYVVPRHKPLTVSSLRRALAEHLPDYMIPGVFMCLPSLPQTPNGKIDRQALPAPDAGRPQLEQAYVAPRTALESELAALWAELLAVDHVGIQDNFFELGGDSLTAVTLMAHIREQHGRNLPLALLFESGTIEKLATVIEQEQQPPEWSPLVAIRPAGSRTPLFCIHPGGGNVLGYNEFIALLDTDQPVYGVQAYGVIEGQEPDVSIPEMAARYIAVIRGVQPHGPYALGGESFGGLVAYEMACQLVEAGERVEFVFLGDTWPPNPALLRSWRFRLATVTYLFTLRWSQWRSLIDRIFGRRPVRVVTKRYTYADELHRRMSLAHRQASGSFVPRAYPGKVTLFRAMDYEHRTGRLQHFHGGPGMHWPKLALGGVDVHWMPGWHGDMMHNANAKGFARTLQDCLNRARLERPPLRLVPVPKRRPPLVRRPVLIGLTALLLVMIAVSALWLGLRTSEAAVVPAPSLASATELRFLAVGRQGYGNSMSERIAEAMERAAAEAPTHGALYLGDNFYPTGVRSVDDPQWQKKFERLYDGAHLRGMPFFVVVGNHDHQGNTSAEVEYGRQRLGSARWQMDDLYYVRDFGRVNGRVLMRVVFLDTITMRDGPEAQVEFARRAFSAPGNPVWRVVAGHYAVRSVTREAVTRKVTLSSLLPRFQEMQVDLYVSANDRFQQILDRPGEPLHVSTNGGSDRQEMGLSPEDAAHDFVVSKPGFAVVTVNPSELAVELRDAAGELRHRMSRLR